VLTQTNAFLAKILANELLAATDDFDGALVGLKCALFISPLVPDRSTVYADLEQPTYTGYAVKDVVWGAPFTKPDGTRAVQATIMQWQMGDSALPTVIYGYGVYLPSGTVLYWLESLPSPVQLTTVTDALIISLEWGVNPASTASVAVIEP
jgi:hypothetical protein